MSLPTPVVSVVIGSLNRRDFIEPTINTIRAELELVDHEIIVVDGGSDDGTLAWLLSQKDVITIVQHNRGVWNNQDVVRKSWGYFMNLGFRAASAPAVCMLSDDCLVVPGAIREGLEVLRANDRTGAVAFYWRNWPEQKRYVVGRTFGDRLFVNHGIYRAEALRDVGYADAETFSFYHADGDLTQRMQEEGWECVDSPGSFIEHHSHANVQQRRANQLTAQNDWTAYSHRWRHLGEASKDWDSRSHHDSCGTAEMYWGRKRMGQVAKARFRLAIAATHAAVRRHLGPGRARS
jgi:glycosyltransferase involved in cell wall biosynthesis